MRSGAQIARLPWHADLERYIWRRASTTVWAGSARSPLLSYRACHARCGARGAFQGSAGAAPAPSHPDHSVVGTVCEVWPHSRKTHRAVCWARAQQGVCTHMTRWEREGTAGHGGTRHFAAACWFAGTHDLRRGRRARFSAGAAAPPRFDARGCDGELERARRTAAARLRVTLPASGDVVSRVLRAARRIASPAACARTPRAGGAARSREAGTPSPRTGGAARSRGRAPPCAASPVAPFTCSRPAPVSPHAAPDTPGSSCPCLDRRPARVAARGPRPPSRPSYRHSAKLWPLIAADNG